MALTLDGRLFHKCAPTVAETTFQKIGMGLRQNQSVFNISESIVHAEGLKYACQVLQRLIVQSFKH